MQIDNQIASRHWRSRRAIPTTFRAAPCEAMPVAFSTRALNAVVCLRQRAGHCEPLLRHLIELHAKRKQVGILADRRAGNSGGWH